MALTLPPTNMMTDQVLPALPGNTKTTGTAVAGAVTVTGNAGVITTESLTTAAAAVYTLTITDTTIAAADVVQVSVQNGTNSAGDPAVRTVAPAAGSLVITIKNTHASAAFNGTLKVAFAVVA